MRLDDGTVNRLEPLVLGVLAPLMRLGPLATLLAHMFLRCEPGFHGTLVWR